VLGAPASIIGSELSSLLGSDLSFVPIVHRIIYGETFCPLQTPVKVATWHTKIRHLAYMLSPSSILQSDQSSSRVPSETPPLPRARPGFSLACEPLILGSVGRSGAEFRLYGFSEVVVPASQVCYLVRKRCGGERVEKGEQKACDE
jgi:hypothetical protein